MRPPFKYAQTAIGHATAAIAGLLTPLACRSSAGSRASSIRMPWSKRVKFTGSDEIGLGGGTSRSPTRRVFHCCTTFRTEAPDRFPFRFARIYNFAFLEAKSEALQ